MDRFFPVFLLFLQIRGYLPFLSKTLLDIAAINCTAGFTDSGNGICRSTIRGPSTQYEAYACCAAENAFISTVKNAFENTNLASQVSYAFQWLGLTCTDFRKTSCLWDNGVAITEISYTNFMPGSPNVTIGACVAMNPHGLWYSIPCGRGDESANMGYYFCQSSPEVYVPTCPISSFYFQGHCYYSLDIQDYNEATETCSNNCGHVASIHSEGENSFVRDIALSNNADLRYSFIGLTYSNGAYRWNDGTRSNFANFGYNNTNLGDCTIMATQDNDLIPQGQWMSTGCSGRTVAVCKTELSCAIPTQTPLKCSATEHLSGIGALFSPGYPLGSEANYCQYVVSEDRGEIIAFTMDELSLDGKSTLKIYNSPMDTIPFVKFDNNSKISNETNYYSASNFLWIVYDTPGNIEFKNRWKLTYGGTKSQPTLTTAAATPATTTEPPTMPPPPSLNCVFAIDWLYLGSSDNPTTNTAYIAQRDFINTVASQLYSTSSYPFGANVAPYGDTDAGQADVVEFEHYILNASDFQQQLSDISPEPQFITWGLCDEEDGFNPGNSINYDNIGRDCLVFFSGENDDDFETCTNSSFTNPLDTSQYKFIIGAGLNGQTGVQALSNVTVPISNNFDANDVSSLVAAIINLAQATR